MRKIIILLLVGVVGILHANELDNISNVDFNFLNKEKASYYLSKEDDFINRLSPFDMSSRMKTSTEVSKEDFIKFISLQTLSWNKDEINRIDKILEKIKAKIGIYNIYFPATIYLIKTTGFEEGNAAYCRGNSIIVIPEDDLLKNDNQIEELLIHEMFHIFSRNNPSIQEKLYSIVGFTKCSELELPETIQKWKITNPDASFFNYYFTSIVHGKELKLMPILLAKSEYDEVRGDDFFDYLSFLFIGIHIEDEKVTPLVYDNKYFIISPDNARNYFDLIGNNTTYTIHPEEVLADNFVLLILQSSKINTPRIIDKMRIILQ